MNRTQLLVLGFFALAWVDLVAILVAVPEINDQALQLSQVTGACVISLSWLRSLRYRNTCGWGPSTLALVVMVAFILGILRVPASIVQLVGL